MGMVRKCFMFNDMNVDDAPGKEELANLIGKGQAGNSRRPGGTIGSGRILQWLVSLWDIVVVNNQGIRTVDENVRHQVTPGWTSRSNATANNPCLREMVGENKQDGRTRLPFSDDASG